jgi:hypothetical protein
LQHNRYRSVFFRLVHPPYRASILPVMSSLPGTERMLETVRASRNRKASEIIEALPQAVRDLTQREELVDDVTVVVIKVEPPSPSPET